MSQLDSLFSSLNVFFSLSLSRFSSLIARLLVLLLPLVWVEWFRRFIFSSMLMFHLTHWQCTVVPPQSKSSFKVGKCFICENVIFRRPSPCRRRGRWCDSAFKLHTLHNLAATFQHITARMVAHIIFKWAGKCDSALIPTFKSTLYASPIPAPPPPRRGEKKTQIVTLKSHSSEIFLLYFFMVDGYGISRGSEGFPLHSRDIKLFRSVEKDCNRFFFTLLSYSFDGKIV